MTQEPRERNVKASVRCTLSRLDPDEVGRRTTGLPGEIENGTAERRRHEGIPIEDATWNRLGDLATRFRIRPLPEVGHR